LEVKPPATGGQQGAGSEAPNAAAISPAFLKNEAFLGIFWSKYFLKNVLLNYCNVS